MPPLLALRRSAALLTVLLVGAPLPAQTAKPEVPHLRTYLKSSSDMAPTLLPGDRVFAEIGASRLPGRGDLVVVQIRQEQWLKRVAAIPGDRIAMRHGVVVLNGQEVPQSAVGDFEIAGEFGLPPSRGRKLSEQFPGEARPHEVLDLRPWQYDDFGESVLGPGQYFLLGDNRDNSMDSRMPDGPMGGIGQIKREQILGLVLYRYWRRGEGWKRVDL